MKQLSRLNELCKNVLTGWKSPASTPAPAPADTPPCRCCAAQPCARFRVELVNEDAAQEIGLCQKHFESFRDWLAIEKHVSLTAQSQ